MLSFIFDRKLLGRIETANVTHNVLINTLRNPRGIFGNIGFRQKFVIVAVFLIIIIKIIYIYFYVNYRKTYRPRRKKKKK